ncbi:12746_t:CDS:2, partial [Gigaspora rosea]
MQLNLEELLASLFYNRWKKDPSEKETINNYIVFSTSASPQPALSHIESSDDQNYQKRGSSNKRITSTIELAMYNMESSNEIQNSNIIGISSQFQDSNSLVQCFVETNFSSNEINL